MHHFGVPWLTQAMKENINVSRISSLKLRCVNVVKVPYKFTGSAA